MNDRRVEESSRDRAFWIVRLATLGGVASALGMTWVFSNLGAAYFSGKPAVAQAPSPVPVEAKPVQARPTVVVKVVHHASQAQAAAPVRPGARPAGAAPRPCCCPRPPAQGPGPAPAPVPVPTAAPPATTTATTLHLNAFEAVLSVDSFSAIGTVNRVVVDDDAALPEAMAIVEAQIKEIDEALQPLP